MKYNYRQNINKLKSIKDIKERQRWFLDETVKFYNLNNRATEKDSCVYSATECSPGCAIGRFLPRKHKALTKKYNNFGYEDQGSSGVNDVLNRFGLPSYMQAMGRDFLSCCQRLHDHKYSWTENGISKVGQIEVADIKNQFGL